jgi:hypothetical protein
VPYQRPKLRPNPHKNIWQNCGICWEYLAPGEQFIKPSAKGNSRTIVCESCGDKILDRNEKVYRQRTEQSEGQLTFAGEIVQAGRLVKVGDETNERQ